MLNLKTHLQNDRKYSVQTQHLLVLLAKKGLSKATSNSRHPLWISAKKLSFQEEQRTISKQRKLPLKLCQIQCINIMGMEQGATSLLYFRFDIQKRISLQKSKKESFLSDSESQLREVSKPGILWASIYTVLLLASHNSCSPPLLSH